MQVSDTHSAPVASALAWLAEEPADDPVVDLAALRAHYAQVRDPGVPVAEFEACLDQLDGRALDICGRFRARLLNIPLPLPAGPRQETEGLIDALLDLSSGFERVLDDVRGRWLRLQRGSIAGLGARALRLLGEAHLLASMIGAAPPAGFWLRVYALLGGAERTEQSAGEGGAGARSALDECGRLFALAALQPESLTGRELVWVSDYLEGGGEFGEVARERLEPESALYWAQTGKDAAPVALSRRSPDDAAGVFFFNAFSLAARAAERLEWLEQRITQADVVGLERDVELLEPDSSGLPAGLTPVEAASLLRRMHERWSVPPHRETVRRQQEYTVQVCAGLRAIWELFRRGEQHARIVEWMVCNESPGGYAVMSVSGVSGVLSAGMVLALRSDAGTPWSLCIVRWIRSDDGEQVELGLQIIAHGASAASVGFRGAEVKSMVPALLLPPLEGVRHHPAIVVKTGSYASRRFVLVDDADKLYVGQGRVVSLDMQTANVELFQYEIDPYPI
ncbi:hypothetical protein E6C76_20730 [Pseudothauera nasutitermitis]|uniref:Uncharacterized protein n=1 Tax=Pseudothauera nasutitermitis TaxID=2565930 RepID=A0A4S4AQP7_9RHOO|nr:hypothetical protein [Pseudothauera nasutitermitis]THF61507.1 hypothetical protein E6C76_20730 [Pseudothauera nasutitermitis]